MSKDTVVRHTVNDCRLIVVVVVVVHQAAPPLTLHGCLDCGGNLKPSCMN